MDPNACYENWLEAVEAGKRYEANEAYSALRAWLDRGGFEPSAWSDPAARRSFFSYNPCTGKVQP